MIHGGELGIRSLRLANVTIPGRESVTTRLYFVRSYRHLHRVDRQKTLARLDCGWGKQRGRLPDRHSHRAIWLCARESVLYCAVFL